MDVKEMATLKAMLRSWCEASQVSPHASPFHVPAKVNGFYVCEQCGNPLAFDDRHGHWFNDLFVIEEEPV